MIKIILTVENLNKQLIIYLTSWYHWLIQAKGQLTHFDIKVLKAIMW